MESAKQPANWHLVSSRLKAPRSCATGLSAPVCGGFCKEQSTRPRAPPPKNLPGEGPNHMQL
eukprot:8599613-Pyramimonas_sp.AAC.1